MGISDFCRNRRFDGQYFCLISRLGSADLLCCFTGSTKKKKVLACWYCLLKIFSHMLPLTVRQMKLCPQKDGLKLFGEVKAEFYHLCAKPNVCHCSSFQQHGARLFRSLKILPATQSDRDQPLLLGRPIQIPYIYTPSPALLPKLDLQLFWTRGHCKTLIANIFLTFSICPP